MTMLAVALKFGNVTYVNRQSVWISKSAMTRRCHATQRLNLTGACEIKPSDRGLRDFL